MQSRSGRTRYKVKTIGRLKDRKSGKVIKSFKESGGGKKPLIGKKTGGVMKAMGGKMAKGYSKGGARIMRAMGGKMAKGYSKGGARMMKAMGGKMAKGYSKGGARMMRARGGKMAKGMAIGGAARAAIRATAATGRLTLPALRAAAKKMGYAMKKIEGAGKSYVQKPLPKATPMKRKKPGYGQGLATGLAGGVGTMEFLRRKNAKKKMSAFETSFAKARKAGKKTFTYKGKKYTTKLKK